MPSPIKVSNKRCATRICNLELEQPHGMRARVEINPPPPPTPPQRGRYPMIAPGIIKYSASNAGSTGPWWKAEGFRFLELETPVPRRGMPMCAF